VKEVRSVALLEGAEETAEGASRCRLGLDVVGILEDVGGSFDSSSFSDHELPVKVELGVTPLRPGCIWRSTERLDIPRGSGFADWGQGVFSKGADWPVTKTWTMRSICLDCAWVIAESRAFSNQAIWLEWRRTQ
jgi:hypothetical protein